MFKIKDGREHFYQWDLNRKLIIEDSSIDQVHFCNKTDNCSLVVEVEDGVANVPNILLQSAMRVYVYGYDKEYTKHCAYFEVAARTKPTDYVYTETEVKTYERLEKDIEALEKDMDNIKGVSEWVAIEPIVEDFATGGTFKVKVGAVMEGIRMYPPYFVMWIEDASGSKIGGKDIFSILGNTFMDCEQISTVEPFDLKGGERICYSPLNKYSSVEMYKFKESMIDKLNNKTEENASNINTLQADLDALEQSLPPIEKGEGSNAIVLSNSSNSATGKNSVTLGLRNQATRGQNFTAGLENVNNGAQSIVVGYRLTTIDSSSAYGQAAFGKFNKPVYDTNRLSRLTIGCGTSESARANSFEVREYTNGEKSIIIGNTELTESDLIKLKALLS